MPHRRRNDFLLVKSSRGKEGRDTERFTVEPGGGIPAYRQLADRIHAQIRSGVLPYGTQLPTVREMAEQTALSPGTVKKTYDRLQECGDIEMTRRRGTFVVFRKEEETDSRKLRAIAAIDRMLTTLGELNLTPAETDIFVNLRLREWGLRQTNIRVGFVTGLGECGAQVKTALGEFANITVSVWDAEQVLRYPFTADEETDLLLATGDTVANLAERLPDKTKLLRIAVVPDRECLLALARAAEGRIAAVSAGEELCRFIAEQFGDRARETVAHVLPADIRTLPKSVTAVVADGAERDWPVATLDALTDAENDGRLIRLRLKPDEGSMLLIGERLRQIREQRQALPLNRASK